MLKIKNRKIIILIVSVLMVVIVAVAFCFSYLDYSEEMIKETINHYFNDRYDNISIQNFDESTTNQTKYYSKRLLSNPTWVNSKDSIEAGRKYFEDTEFITLILTSSTEKVNRNEYKAKISVLYANEHGVHDNFVNYEYLIKINKQGFHKYVFDHIEVTSNKITYINGGELHAHDGEAVVHNDEGHNDNDSH